MKKNLQSFVKNLQSLKDLRLAIDEVKKANLHKNNVIPLKPKEEPKQDIKQEVVQNSHLKHLGINTTKPGVISHQVGMPGSNKFYQIDVDMNAIANGHPAFSVHLADSQNGIQSRHPEIHKDIKSAVKALVNHSFKKKWE